MLVVCICVCSRATNQPTASSQNVKQVSDGESMLAHLKSWQLHRTSYVPRHEAIVATDRHSE